MARTVPLSGSPPLYAQLKQSDELDFDLDLAEDDTLLSTSTGPHDSKASYYRPSPVLLSRSACLTLSLCLVCSLVTLVGTLYGTLVHHERIVEWIDRTVPSTLHVQSLFSVHGVSLSQPHHFNNTVSPLFDSVPSSTPLSNVAALPAASSSSSSKSYYAVSPAANSAAAPIPPTHSSTLYNTTSASLPLYVADTHIDHTSSRRAFQLLDQALAGAGRWPGRVDLMVRTTVFSATILPLMFQSIELFWPRNIGRCIVVGDERTADRWQLPLAMPDWCELHYEYVLPEMANRGRWAMQWHDFWGDNYTRADFVAVADTDSYFTFKITPDVLFDAQGRVVMPIDSTMQRGMYDVDTAWWVGNGSQANASATPAMAHLLPYFPINFMQNLPIVMPTALYAAFRQHVVERHAGGDGTVNSSALHFDGVNRMFMERHMHEPSQFCILGNYWLYFSPPHLRNQLHILLTDHSTLDIDRQQLGLPSTNGTDPVEKAYQVVLKATMHVPHDSYYRGHPNVVKRHKDDKIDEPSLYYFSQQQFHTTLCAVQRYWRHVDRAVWSLLCGEVTEEARALHQDLAVQYCYVQTSWQINRDMHPLVTVHAYEAKWAWMGDIVNAAYEKGREAAIDVVKRYPTHVEWDREQQRLKKEAALALEVEQLRVQREAAALLEQQKANGTQQLAQKQ